MIEKFIKDNKLSFGVGSRNSTVTTLVGYAQHLGMRKIELLEGVSKQIVHDKFIQDEVNRLWDYCEENNYKNYWTTKLAKKSYKF